MKNTIRGLFLISLYAITNLHAADQAIARASSPTKKVFSTADLEMLKDAADVFDLASETAERLQGLKTTIIPCLSKALEKDLEAQAKYAEMEKALKAAQEEKEKIVARLSHEAKTERETIVASLVIPAQKELGELKKREKLLSLALQDADIKKRRQATAFSLLFTGLDLRGTRTFHHAVRSPDQIKEYCIKEASRLEKPKTIDLILASYSIQHQIASPRSAIVPYGTPPNLTRKKIVFSRPDTDDFDDTVYTHPFSLKSASFAFKPEEHMSTTGIKTASTLLV